MQPRSPDPSHAAKPPSPVVIPPIVIPKEDLDAYSEDSSVQGQNVQPHRLSAQLPFNNAYDIDIIVDALLGLPITTTATRIVVKLVMPTKESVGGEAAHEQCDLTSEASCPFFRFRHQWRGKLCLLQ